MTNDESPLSLPLRRAMRRMAASVCVVTATDGDGNPYAMTANSVTSVSMEPPSLLVCINHQAGIYQALNQGRPFCVNILNHQQRDVAELCSIGPESRDRFARGQWQTHESGIPYLAQAQANIFCLNDTSLCYATHTIFIGRVESVTIQGGVSPLIYLDGSFVAARPASE